MSIQGECDRCALEKEIMPLWIRFFGNKQIANMICKVCSGELEKLYRDWEAGFVPSNMRD